MDHGPRWSCLIKPKVKNLITHSLKETFKEIYPPWGFHLSIPPNHGSASCLRIDFRGVNDCTALG
jgi:hypothetical protein